MLSGRGGEAEPGGVEHETRDQPAVHPAQPGADRKDRGAEDPRQSRGGRR